MKIDNELDTLHLINSNFENIQETIEKKQNSSLTSSPHDDISLRLSKILCDDSGKDAWELLTRISNQLFYEQEINGQQNIFLINLVLRLRDLMRSSGKISLKEYKKVRQAVSELIKYTLITNRPISHTREEGACNRKKAVSKSILMLKKKHDIEVKINNGEVEISTACIEKVSKKICLKMQQLGGLVFLKGMFNVLQKQFHNSQKRYHFPISSDFLGQKMDPTIPWGYLFNIAIKYPNRIDQGIFTDVNVTFKEIIETSKNLVSALDIEPYGHMDTQFKSGEYASKMLSELSLLSTNFSIPQFRYTDFIKLFDGIFDWLKFESKEIRSKIRSYKIFLQNLIVFFSEKTNDPLVIKKGEMPKLKGKLSNKKFLQSLSCFVHESSPNQDFLTPNDFRFSNALLKPLIRIDDNCLLIPCKGWAMIAFYEAICSEFRPLFDKHYFDSSIGNQFEVYVRNLLKESGFTIKSGKYKNFDNETTDLDLYFENQNRNFFIEVKKKSLTAESKSGEEYKLLIDYANSLLYSQIQILGHKLTLLNEGRIDLFGGDAINVNDKINEDISLILFDYGYAQDRTVIQQFLRLYLTYTMDVNVVEKSKAESIISQFNALNKKCQKFIKLFDLYQSNFQGDQKNLFFDSWFLSLAQLHIVLDSYHQYGDLNSLQKLKHFTTKNFDFYYEFANIEDRRRNKSLG